MKTSLGMVLGIIVSATAATAGAECDRLSSLHRVSYRGQEKRLFERVVELVRRSAVEAPDALAVVRTLEACLHQARERAHREGSESPFASLAELDLGIEDDATIVMSVRANHPRKFAIRENLPALASRTVRKLSSDANEPETLTEDLWFLWFLSYMEATGGRYNWYDYADELAKEEAADRGRSFAVGFELEIREQRLLVGAVRDEALEAAGLRRGAEILGFDGRSIRELTLPEFQRLWFSPEPFSYVVSVAADPEPLGFAGRSIPTRHTTLSWAVLGKTGYIRIHRFAKGTLIEIRRAMRRLEAEEISALLLDVRSNPGGTLATGVIDMFFKPGKTVVSYRDHEADTVRDVEATVEYYGLPTAILVDRDSASMAETLAAAFLTHERGPVIGEGTVGKGVGQHVYRVLDEGRLHLVNRTYFYPGTRETWNGKGIRPDLEIELDEDTRERLEPLIRSPVLRLDEQWEIDPALKAAVQHLEEPS